MMALSGVRSSWLILARNFDLACIGLLGAGFLLGIFLGEIGELVGLPFQRLLRLAQIVDRGDAALFAFDQLLLVQLDLGDVGADRDVAAVLGAPFADVHPAAVVELRLEGTRAGLRLRAVFVGDRGADDGLSSRRRRRFRMACRRRPPRRADDAVPENWNCTAPGGCRRPTTRRLPGSSRWRRAAADRRPRSSPPGFSAR